MLIVCDRNLLSGLMAAGTNMPELERSLMVAEEELGSRLKKLEAQRTADHDFEREIEFDFNRSIPKPNY